MSIKLGNRVVSGNNAVHKANKTLDNITQKGEENIVKSLYNANASMGSNKLILANNLFDIKMTDHLLSGSEAAGWKLAGSRVYKSDYPSFYDRCVREYNESIPSKTYIKENVGIVGNLENKRGVLSGFTFTDYATTNYTIPSSITSFEIQIKATVPENPPAGSAILGQQTTNLENPQVSFNNGILWCGISANMTVWDVALYDPSYNFANKTVTVKFSWDGATYTVKFTTDGVNWVDYASMAFTSAPTWRVPHYIGWDDNANIATDIKVDLKDCYIKINGALAWEGAHHASVTEHANGHVFYDIANISDIERVYDALGEAEFYGIDLVNEYVILPRPAENYNNFYYYCVGNTEVGEQTIDVSAEYQLNNPFFFGMNKYFEKAPNNLSWLKSDGAFHTRAMYPSFYDWAVEQHANGVEGFVLSTDTYDDYALVINKEDETFRLPLLNGEEDVLGNEFEDIPFTTSTSGTIKSTPKRRAFFLAQGSMTNDCYVQTLSLEPNFYNHAYHYSYTGSTALRILHPHVFKPNVEVSIGYKNITLTYLRWYYAVGNGDLYYYVGETVNNAKVIDVAKLTEDINNNVIRKGSDELDGVWTNISYAVASSVQISTSKVTYDISDALPKDEYDYEILVHGAVTTAATSGAYINLYVSTDVISSSTGVCGCRARTAATVSSYGNIIIPVSSQRILTVANNGSGNGTYVLSIYGYRRLGKRRK